MSGVLYLGAGELKLFSTFVIALEDVEDNCLVAALLARLSSPFLSYRPGYSCLHYTRSLYGDTVRRTALALRDNIVRNAVAIGGTRHGKFEQILIF